MRKLRFSIITPSYNQADFIEQNILSVINQGYDNYEHIVVDGGSSDNTVEILKKYHHLRWVSEKDKGQSDAINKGLKMATGDIICWINSDDELADNALNIAAGYFEQHSDKVAVSGARIDIDATGKVIKEVASRKYFFEHLLNIDKDVCQPSTFIRKSVFDEVGLLRTELNYAMDYELFLRITQKYEIDNIAEPLARFRWHDESKTESQPISMLREQVRVRKEYGGRLICPASLEIVRISAILRIKSLLGKRLYNKIKTAKGLLFNPRPQPQSDDKGDGRIKLLLLDDSLPVGGKEILLLTYLSMIDRTKIDVHFICQANQGTLLPEAIELADHYLCLERKKPFDLKSIIRLRRYLKSNSIDIVHTHHWLASLYLFFASHGLRLKKITTLHGYDRDWRNYLIERQVLKSFDRICCVSNAQALHYYIAGMPWTKIKVLYNCYNAEQFQHKSVYGNSRDSAFFEMVMVANHRWIKDTETAIKATLLLNNIGEKIRLHLVGDFGELTSKYAGCESIVFHGQRKIDGKFLSQFDLFVFSSFADTFGIALVEAMHCGLPVLVSDIPASMEVISHGDYGFHFQTGNPQACADMILKIKSQPALRDVYAERAYKRSLEFSPEISLAALEAFYLDLF
jgi:glycosyltransferase involved in cell wall biosynthesis